MSHVRRTLEAAQTDQLLDTKNVGGGRPFRFQVAEEGIEGWAPQVWLETIADGVEVWVGPAFSDGTELSPIGATGTFRATLDVAALTLTAEYRQGRTGAWTPHPASPYVIDPATYKVPDAGWPGAYVIGSAEQFHYVSDVLTVDELEVAGFTETTFRPDGPTTAPVDDYGNPMTITSEWTAPLPAPWHVPGWTSLLFGGFADDWTPQWSATPEDRRTTLKATDGVRILAGYNPPAGPGTGNGETSDERIHRILDHADWPVDQRNISDNGGWQMDATTHNQPAWTELLLTADSDLGYLWLGPDGHVHYLTGEDIRTIALDPIVTFGCDGLDVILEASPTFALDGIRNVVAAANAQHGTIVSDEASVARYRAWTYSRTDLKMDDQAQVLAWADQVLARSANPRRHISQLLIDPTLAPESFRWLLVPHPTDIWLIRWTPPGDETAHVVEESVYAGGWVHTVDADSWETVVTTGIVTRADPLQRKPR